MTTGSRHSNGEREDTALGASALGAGTPGGSRCLERQSGLVIVDKSPGMTSHDVVAKMRRLAKTRRVGHAGTLDPLATGVLVIGVEKATRLLGHLVLTEKEYAATIRLGQSTVTDDADGDILPPPADAFSPACAVAPEDLRIALVELTGELMQVPPRVSAIKVGGQRAYHLTRSGAAPTLAPRRVTVRRLDLLATRQVGDLLDIDVDVTCSSGTYIRAIARDLGATLGTGGHLTALRRTRVGPYRLDGARTLDELTENFELIPLGRAAAEAFPSVHLNAEEARLVSHGARLLIAELERAFERPMSGPVAAFGPDGTFIALMIAEQGKIQPITVFVP